MGQKASLFKSLQVNVALERGGGAGVLILLAGHVHSKDTQQKGLVVKRPHPSRTSRSMLPLKGAGVEGSWFSWQGMSTHSAPWNSALARVVSKRVLESTSLSFTPSAVNRMRSAALPCTPSPEAFSSACSTYSNFKMESPSVPALKVLPGLKAPWITFCSTPHDVPDVAADLAVDDVKDSSMTGHRLQGFPEAAAEAACCTCSWMEPNCPSRPRIMDKMRSADLAHAH